MENARAIFEKATSAEFKYVDDLASVWCEYAEMEMRRKNYKNALNLLRRATAAPLNLDRRQVIFSTLLVSRQVSAFLASWMNILHSELIFSIPKYVRQEPSLLATQHLSIVETGHSLLQRNTCLQYSCR